MGKSIKWGEAQGVWGRIGQVSLKADYLFDFDFFFWFSSVSLASSRSLCLLVEHALPYFEFDYPTEPWQLNRSRHGDSLASFCQAIYIHLFSHGLVSRASRRSALLTCLTSDQTDGFRVDYFSLPLALDWLNGGPLLIRPYQAKFRLRVIDRGT